MGFAQARAARTGGSAALRQNPRVAQGDLERPDLEELQWSTEQRSASLSRVFEHAVRLAANAERWYAQKRRPKRQWGRVLRVGAIVLGAVAAVLPILAEISADDGRPSIAPGWAAVALACAAALVALDRYLGFSTAWMRFMKAEMQITRLRHGFEYAWQDALVKAATPPSDDEATKLLALAREFALAVDDAMADEIAAWTSEFTTSLERADESLRASDRQP